MKDYLTLGPTPCEEKCEPNTGNKARMSLEHREYIRMLEAKFAHYKCIKFVVKEFPHDFGPYSEVCVVWNNAEGQWQAEQVDNNLPGTWDDEALKALADFDSLRECKA